jgi:hypothetical protein
MAKLPTRVEADGGVRFLSNVRFNQRGLTIPATPWRSLRPGIVLRDFVEGGCAPDVEDAARIG